MWLENLKKYSLLKINLKTLIHTLKWTGLAFLFTFLPLYFLILLLLQSMLTK